MNRFDDVVSRRDALKMLAAGALAAGATAALGVSTALPALAGGERAVVVNRPEGSRGEMAVVEVRVFVGDRNDSLRVFNEIRRGRCHVNCYSSSDGYDQRRDRERIPVRWLGDRMAFDFLCSERPQDDNIHCQFGYMNSSSPDDPPMYSTNSVRVALS